MTRQQKYRQTEKGKANRREWMRQARAKNPEPAKTDDPGRLRAALVYLENPPARALPRDIDEIPTN